MCSVLSHASWACLWHLRSAGDGLAVFTGTESNVLRPTRVDGGGRIPFRPLPFDGRTLGLVHRVVNGLWQDRRPRNRIDSGVCVALRTARICSAQVRAPSSNSSPSRASCSVAALCGYCRQMSLPGHGSVSVVWWHTCGLLPRSSSHARPPFGAVSPPYDTFVNDPSAPRGLLSGRPARVWHPSRSLYNAERNGRRTARASAAERKGPGWSTCPGCRMIPRSWPVSR